MKRPLTVAGCFAALLVTALGVFMYLHGDTDSNERAMFLPPHPDPVIIEMPEGHHEIVVEIADEPLERQRGLMYRERMERGHGMLFVFDTTERQGFWMKNTPLPLDLLFIAENGRVVAIRDGIPFSEKLIAPIYPVRFVLEVNAGVARQNGIGIGARLRHPVIDAISGAH